MDENYTRSNSKNHDGPSQYIEPPVQFHPTPRFCPWLEKMNVSLAFASTRANKLVIVGQQAGRLKIFTRTIEKIQALFAQQDKLYIAAQNAVWTYVDISAGRPVIEGHDALYYPRRSQITGPLDIHDIYVPRDPARSPIFANTQFSCVAETDDTYNFHPLWKPSFISALVPEDRCHLSGVAIDPDIERPRYITVAAQTDYYEAWRLQRSTGGAVIDVETGQIVLMGLSLPHAPRIHQGSLYVLDTGGGRLLRVIAESKSSEEICNFPGLVKGLCFIGNYAIVTVSGFAHKDSVTDLPFYERAQTNDKDIECAVHIVDLEKKESVHALHITGALKEIDSVAIIHGRENPAILRQEPDALENLYYLPKSSIGDPEHAGSSRPARRSLKALEEDFLLQRYQDFSIINVFDAVIPEVKAALIEFWLEKKALPRQDNPHIRAAQACLLALNPKGEIIADITIYEDILGSVTSKHSAQHDPETHNRFYFLRALADPDYSHLNLTAKMVLHAYDLLKVKDTGSSDKPKGMIMIAENEKLTCPLILKRFERFGFEILPMKTQKGHMIIRKMF